MHFDPTARRLCPLAPVARRWADRPGWAWLPGSCSARRSPPCGRCCCSVTRSHRHRS